jgi:thiosulfate/3-mercaptopyruvate sulfurtransferase
MSVPGYAKDVLVDADWAVAHIEDPDIRFVEVDVDTNAYDEGHIPGAVAWNWTSQLSDGVRRDIVSRDELSRLLSESGIGPETTIVLYGDNNNWFAAWAYWQLKLFGFERVRILDGGRKYWVAQGLPTSTDVPSFEPTGVKVDDADFSHRAFRDDVLEQIDSPGALVDVRSPAEYNGELLAPAALPQEGAQRAGHVPGAENIPWASAVNEDGTFKAADELRDLYAAKGITGDRDVITYCRIGERSSHTWFVLHELLGFERVRNYDGSWTEYGSLVGVPIEKSIPVGAPA